MQGNPLHTATQCGAQVFREQFDKILSYMEIGRGEGAKMLIGGGPASERGWRGASTSSPPSSGQNKMRVFQEEILGPALGVTTFKDEGGALAIANDTQYGLGAGLWNRTATWPGAWARHPGRPGLVGLLPRLPGPRGVWRSQKSGIGRETHKMMLDHYQNTKNLLVSYSDKPLGLF
ncbi:aldehyde dehydrogenase family protein [Escherichia coli]